MADLGLCRTPVQRLISYPIHRHRCLLNVGGGEGAREIRGRTLIGRRQSFWDSERLKIRESLARQVCNVMRLDDGASSGDWRLSVV